MSSINPPSQTPTGDVVPAPLSTAKVFHPRRIETAMTSAVPAGTITPTAVDHRVRPSAPRRSPDPGGGSPSDPPSNTDDAQMSRRARWWSCRAPCSRMSAPVLARVSLPTSRRVCSSRHTTSAVDRADPPAAHLVEAVVDAHNALSDCSSATCKPAKSCETSHPPTASRSPSPRCLCRRRLSARAALAPRWHVPAYDVSGGLGIAASTVGRCRPLKDPCLNLRHRRTGIH